MPFILCLQPGSFSDRSDERELYDSELEAVFGGKEHEVLEMNAQDGTFFMRYESVCADQRRVRCSCTLRLQLNCTSS
jgi:hypothetical protein